MIAQNTIDEKVIALAQREACSPLSWTTGQLFSGQISAEDICELLA